MGIIDKMKGKWVLGGPEYLAMDILGYPSRFLKNRRMRKKQEQLLRYVNEARIDPHLKLSGRDAPKVVVSVTSYPQRFGALYYCLKSILLQTVLPDRIIVYLGSDSKKEDITADLSSLKKFGVEIRIDEEKNLKPHIKYYYAMQEFPKASVITIDDDLVYPPDMVESLIVAHEKYPGSICARRAHKITYDRSGKVKPYLLWKGEYERMRLPSNSLLATGCGGVLYPPDSIDIRAFDASAIESLCLKADDIWLKCMEVLRGTKVVYVPSEITFAGQDGTQETALQKTNNGPERMNDVYLHAVMKEYGISHEQFGKD